jgi:hypothetical protein
MRAFDTATTTALAAPNVHAEILIWIRAKNRVTGVIEPQGFWTGEGDRLFNPEGDSGDRLYKGDGRVVEVENFQFREGLEILTHRFSLAMADADVEALIRGTDCRMARVEIHRALFDDDGNLIGTPHPMRIGDIDEQSIMLAASGYVAQLVSVPLTRMGTVTLQEKRSHATQQDRSNDKFFRYKNAPDSVVEPFGTGQVNGGGQAKKKRRK